MAKYLTDGASLSCPMGSSSATLKVSATKIKACGNPMANMFDAKPMVNIPSFGMCKITKAPCVPGTCCWITSSKVMVRGAPSVDDSCKTICPLGGNISVSSAGQSKVNKV